MNVNEIWKDVPGYEGFYQASNFGRVKSCSRKITGNYNDRFKKVNLLKGKLLKSWTTSDGYLMVGLHKNGKRKLKRIHRIVLETFVGDPKKGEEAMHLDGDAKNNTLSNLRYGSRSCNSAFKMEHGTAIRRESNPSAKLDSYKVMLIRMFHHFEGVSIRKLADMFNVCQRTIWKVVMKRTWR